MKGLVLDFDTGPRAARFKVKLNCECGVDVGVAGGKSRVDQQVQRTVLGWDHYDPAARVLFVSFVQFVPNAENVGFPRLTGHRLMLLLRCPRTPRTPGAMRTRVNCGAVHYCTT